VSIDGRTFSVLGGGPLATNGVISLSVGGLPGRTWLQSLQAALPRSGLPPAVPIVAAGLAALAPVAYVLRRRPCTTQPALPTRDGLLDQLAALDDAHERGELEETAYTKQRAALKGQLQEMERDRGH
jgi:hypothetical protein